ncbi:hypothetical protein GWE18_14795 [Bradyrhizobium sp. CSA112]|uniref:hypothetical protein n=1 Tax=Bradyrhizobium sp. CSA112 TaxID=2699170 RepID=UPI0023AF02CE|nr:hypothetical protein [Bradyrhizobium sp. CSA112]MDE5454099.1 hypothetical protein [Bradyrhizobium sp. CSA112]
MGPSYTFSRKLAAAVDETIQLRFSEQKAAEIDLMRKNANEIYEIVFSADRAETPSGNE